MSAGFGSRMSLGVRLSLLFAACTAAVSLIAGLIFSRAIDEHFVEPRPYGDVRQARGVSR